MKALSITSLFVLGLTGTACSQAADTSAEAQTPEIQAVEAGQDTGGSFNLELPAATDAAESASSSGFNLDLGDSGTSNTDGFNLGTDLGASDGLSDLPEIEVGPVDALPEAPQDEDPVIRIE